jgi:hypothetical protein
MHWYCRIIVIRSIPRIQRLIQGPRRMHMLLCLFQAIKLTTEGVFCLFLLFRLMITKCWMTAYEGVMKESLVPRGRWADQA